MRIVDMQTIAEYMSAKHLVCDEAAIAEQAALVGNWSGAEAAFNNFHTDLVKHFRMEEEILFHKLISVGGPAGPMQMMRMEHERMNTLIEQMAGTLICQDAQGYGSLSEMLLIVMRNHNLKEEYMLDPIADYFLESTRETLLDRMRVD